MAVYRRWEIKRKIVRRNKCLPPIYAQAVRWQRLRSVPTGDARAMSTNLLALMAGGRAKLAVHPLPDVGKRTEDSPTE